MSTANEMSAPCPACHQQTAKRHCKQEGAQCHWIRCMNSACELVADMARGKGFRKRKPLEPERDSKGIEISHMPWSIA